MNMTMFTALSFLSFTACRRACSITWARAGIVILIVQFVIVFREAANSSKYYSTNELANVHFRLMSDLLKKSFVLTINTE